MKKALIFDPFDDYAIRIRYIEQALKNNGYEVQIFFADFDHYRKEYVKNRRKNVTYLHVPSYHRNLSYARIHSHEVFAAECVKRAEEEKDVSLIYAMVPPNTMMRDFARYKKGHPEVRLVADLCDMWPESLPVSGKVKKMAAPVLNLWKNRRDHFLSAADLVLCECRLFQKTVEPYSEHIRTVYLCQDDHIVSDIHYEADSISFLYCGSINHIIDLDQMTDLLQKVNSKKHVILHIIGDGEERDAFLQKLKDAGIAYVYHGRVYEEEKKKEIYGQCQYGLNIMKKSVYVGLTMKSLDYMSHGLPLVSNIPADTEKIIEERKTGFHVQNVYETSEKLLSVKKEEYEQMVRNTSDVFHELFSSASVMKQLNEVFAQL